jgi:hypothetical protein
MRADLTLVREPSDRGLPGSVFVRAERAPHRPILRFRGVNIASKDDLRVARRAGLPLSLLESDRIEKLGYPLSFRPRLIVDRELLSLLCSRFQVIPFSDPGAARDPGIEDLVVAMLSIDPLGARRIARDHRTQMDPVHLLKRVLAENLERRAYEVRLDQFAPGLPKSAGVEPLSRRALEAEDSREYSRGP